MDNKDNAHREISDKSMIFVIIGILIICGVALWSYFNWQFIRHAEIAKGTVTRLAHGGSHPEIQFTTKEGKVIEYTQGGVIFGYKKGEKVQVYYLPKSPNICDINTFGSLWGFPIALFTLGVIFLSTPILIKKGWAEFNF